MTKLERNNFKNNFRKRRTSNIVHFQSGYEQQFGLSHIDGSPLKQKPVLEFDYTESAWVPGGKSGADPDSWRDDLTSASASIARACTKVGDEWLSNGLSGSATSEKALQNS